MEGLNNAAETVKNWSFANVRHHFFASNNYDRHIAHSVFLPVNDLVHFNVGDLIKQNGRITKRKSNS